jgi:peptide deformylase
MAKSNGKLVDQIRKDDPIVKYEGDGASILRQKSKPILSVGAEHAELVAQMEIIMHAANGVGLAAPQLGILQRLFVFDAGDGFQAVLNPKILQRKGTQVGVEGCLSLPGLYGDVERAEVVVVKGVDQYGKPLRIRADGLSARVMQHEIDHLDGILFTDLADPDSLHWASPGDAAEGSDTRQLRE